MVDPMRGRRGDGLEEPAPIDMWATSYLLSPGDRLRVDITSSNYPRLARNLNTGAPFAKSSEMKVARQTIHLSAEHSSHVVLPVIPRQ